MTERDRLLRAAVGALDRTPLLAYADYVLENGYPAAEATAEFIHLACQGKSLRRLTAPVHCLDWLRANWTRLIPSVAAKASPVNYSEDGFIDSDGCTPQPFGYGAQVRNTEIQALVGLAGAVRQGERVYPCSLKLKVGFGLLIGAEMKSPWGKKQVWPLLLRDQPQIELPFPPAPELSAGDTSNVGGAP